jgi:hypothetical protein
LPFGILGKFAEVFRKPVSEAHVERMLVKLKSLGEARESVKLKAESVV